MHNAVITPDWQRALCQFFTRDAVARFCLDRLAFPKDILAIRLLEPAAGRGAFILPLIPRLVQACRSQRKRFRCLTDAVRAYEVDGKIATNLRKACVGALEDSGMSIKTARRLVRHWVINADFLDAEILSSFTHIVSNPPYIRWDAIPKPLITSYRERFDSFKARADLYVAFIDKSLTLLEPHGQLAFLCPGNWTRNTYGASVREALTRDGRLDAIIDFTDVDNFEQTADAYPSFFVFTKGRIGSTEILSVVGSDAGVTTSGEPVRRYLPCSSGPFVLASDSVARFVDRAKRAFPTLEAAGCSVRVGSATGCNPVFLGPTSALPVEPDRLLRFVNARSIRDASVRWSGTHIVNVFDDDSKPVDLEAFPQLRAYLRRHRKELKARAKAGKSACWWRTIDVLQSEWYKARKLLVADISSQPVIGLDRTGYCAGSGVYQIKSFVWPLEDLLVVLSAGILGVFVSAMSQRSANGFNRFQKGAISTLPLPRWGDIDAVWRRQFREARVSRDATLTLELVGKLYGCDADILTANTARDWLALSGRKKEGAKTCARQALDGERADDGEGRSHKGRTHSGSVGSSVKDWRRNGRDHTVA